MATSGSPTIFEPNTSSDAPLPSIPRLSPQPSSSSDSFDSSQPNSDGSSATSRSVSPTPNPKSVPATDSQEPVELPALPSNPQIPENTLASQSHRQNDPPRSIPPTPAVNTRINHEASWLSRLGSLVPRKNWFANALGVISLGLTVIGMILFGERTYKLAVWSAWNDALDTCGQLNSTGVTLGQNCKKLLSNNTADVTLPPFSHWKRTWIATLRVGSTLLEDGFTKRSTLPTDELGYDAVNLSLSKFSSVAIILASTVIMGGLSLIVFRRYWSNEEVFTSPVRSDWQFTWYHQEGPETVSGEGYRMIRCNPADNHPLGQLRQGIRRSQPNAVENPTSEPTWVSHNTSEDTLVGLWKDTKWGTSKVSLTNDASDEKHENLIELETDGPNKTFFDPETGEFIHLTPWKSTGDEEVHGLKPDGKGSTKRALIRMTLGASGWAGGKNIDDQLAEELQANSKGVKKKELKPHQAGDCITGDMANEVPSGKPITV